MLNVRWVVNCRYDSLKREGLKEERLLLLEAWRDIESDALQRDDKGSSREQLALVDAKFPKKVKMRRTLDNGVEEEYFNYVFPDDEKKMGTFPLIYGFISCSC